MMHKGNEIFLSICIKSDITPNFMLPPLIFARNGSKNEDAECGGDDAKCCAQEDILRKVASKIYA